MLRWLVAPAAAFLAFGSIACTDGGGSSGTGAGTSSEIEGPLGEAARAVPSDATAAYYTHWVDLAEALDVEIFGDMTENQELFVAMSESGATPVEAYTDYLLEDHEENVGWLLTDVEWEIAFARPDAPVGRIFGFGDEFDTGALVSLFEERGYETQEHDGVTIYHHDMDREAEWQVNEFGPAIPFELLNVAILEDNVVVMSSEQSEVEAAVTAVSEDESAALSTVMATADAHQDSPLAMFTSGEEAICESWIEGPSTTSQIAAALDQYRGSPYVSLGIGYRFEDGEPSAEAILRYEDASQAEQDLDVRENAATASSPVTREPYGESSFQLAEAVVEENDIVLRLTSVDGSLHVADEMRRGGLLFAAC